MWTQESITHTLLCEKCQIIRMIYTSKQKCVISLLHVAVQILSVSFHIQYCQYWECRVGICISVWDFSYTIQLFYFLHVYLYGHTFVCVCDGMPAKITVFLWCIICVCIGMEVWWIIKTGTYREKIRRDCVVVGGGRSK